MSRPLSFNANWYLSQNPDVAAAIEARLLTDVAQHFDLFGRSEGRSASPVFDSQHYLAQNPDVAEAVVQGLITAWDHFEQFGAVEGRSPTPLFNEIFYLQQNPDVAAAIENGLISSAAQHFAHFGQSEPRSINPAIDLGKYLKANPDVAQAVAKGIINPLDHLIQYGVTEGRSLGNGVSLAHFSEDPGFNNAISVNNFTQALNRVTQVAPFIPAFERPDGWTLPYDTPIPLDFVPPPGSGITLVIPPEVFFQPGTSLLPIFQPSGSEVITSYPFIAINLTIDYFRAIRNEGVIFGVTYGITDTAAAILTEYSVNGKNTSTALGGAAGVFTSNIAPFDVSIADAITLKRDIGAIVPNGYNIVDSAAKIAELVLAGGFFNAWSYTANDSSAVTLTMGQATALASADTRMPNGYHITDNYQKIQDVLDGNAGDQSALLGALSITAKYGPLRLTVEQYKALLDSNVLIEGLVRVNDSASNIADALIGNPSYAKKLEVEINAQKPAILSLEQIYALKEASTNVKNGYNAANKADFDYMVVDLAITIQKAIINTSADFGEADFIHHFKAQNASAPLTGTNGVQDRFEIDADMVGKALQIGNFNLADGDQIDFSKLSGSAGATQTVLIAGLDHWLYTTSFSEEKNELNVAFDVPAQGVTDGVADFTITVTGIHTLDHSTLVFAMNPG